MSHVAGVLLAAGSGRRFGGPKALADTGSGPWVLRALETLADVSIRVVVVGAAADRVRRVLPEGIMIAENPRHAGGMGSSLVAGLQALPAEVDAAVIMLVDLPDVPREAVRRVIGVIDKERDRYDVPLGKQSGRDASPPRDATHILARATYRGRPGHPVLIGSAHFSGVIEAASGDRGARDYLAEHPVVPVECGDLAGGEDVDELPSRVRK